MPTLLKNLVIGALFLTPLLSHAQDSDAPAKKSPRKAAITGDVKQDLKTEASKDAAEQATKLIDEEIANFESFIGKEFTERKCQHVQAMVRRFLAVPIDYDPTDPNGSMADRSNLEPLAGKIAKAVAADPKTFSTWIDCAESAFSDPSQPMDDVIRHEGLLSRALKSEVSTERATLEFHRKMWTAGTAIVGFGGGAGGRFIAIVWDDIAGAWLDTKFGGYLAKALGFVTKEEKVVQDNLVAGVTDVAGANAGAFTETQATKWFGRLNGELSSLHVSGMVTGGLVSGTIYLFPAVTVGDIDHYVQTSDGFMDDLTTKAEQNYKKKP